jgi:hypothetical protein
MNDESCCPPAGPFTSGLIPCTPGPHVYPACYTVPPGETVFEGFKSITLNPDCTAASVVILDSNSVPVPGAVETGCPDESGCCDTTALCGIFQGFPTQVPGITDMAIFVTPAGCFLGVPGGGGGGFPGYGVPVSTACANAAGVSLLVARADHVHRAAQAVDLAGVLIGTRCAINFISAGSVVTPTVLVVDNGGSDRVDVTINAQQILNVFEDATLIATNPDELHFEDGLLATVTSPTVHVNLDYGTPPVNTVHATAPSAGVSTQVLRADAVLQALTAAPVTIGIANAIGVAAGLARADHVHRGAVPVAQNGSPVATEPGINIIDGTGISTTVVDDPGNNQVNITIASTVTPFPGYGTPVSTAQANAAGISLLVAREDHVHRTIVQFQDSGVLISSRPTVNFIDGTGITITVVDDGGSDRANVTIANSTGVTGFATPTVAADAAAATGGAATTAIRSDAKLQVSTAAPTVTVKSEATAASTGVAATLLRTDAQIQALTAAPSVNVLSDASTFSQGAASSLLRSDCRFIATTAVPVATGTANAQGVATTLARSDHVHLTSFTGMVFSRGATVLNPAVQNTIVWRAPFACTVTNVRGYRVGGTGATINARRNGVSNHLAAAVSLAAADTWVDGGAVANTAYVAGDKLEIMVVTITAAPTQIAVQVDYTRA